MKGIVYRSAALALACIVALSVLAVPSFATDYQSTYNFWNWAYDNSWFLGKAIIGFSAGNVCQVSEDGLHHATTHSGGGGSVDGQRVYKCVCDLCGQEFQAVATDLEQTYNNNREYDSISSDLTYSPNTKWFFTGKQSVSTCVLGWSDYDTVSVTHSVNHNTYLSFDIACNFYLEKSAFVYIGAASKTTLCNSNTQWFHTSGYVCDSSYNRVSSLGAISQKQDYVMEAGYYQLECTVYASCNNHLPGVTEYIDIIFPPITVTFEELQFFNDRPSIFSPSFSYENENGKETVSDQQIIDEQGLYYYNPVTNTTTNITNWTYDYSDRSYTCTTENNTTTTITYGDEYITINEGDVNNTYITYNIYYYTTPEDSGDGSGSGDNSDDGSGIGGGLGELLGSLLGGLIDLITGLISGLIDSLINLVEMTIEKLGQVVNLFGEFGDALKVLWSWLPDEVVTILAAGVSVVVFASVIKLFV